MPLSQRRGRPVWRSPSRVPELVQLTSRQIEDDELDQDSRPRQRPNRNGSDDEAGGESGDGEDGDSSQDADRQLAKKLIRYAISCEYSRTPIRRDGIKERGSVRPLRVVAVIVDSPSSSWQPGTVV